MQVISGQFTVTQLVNIGKMEILGKMKEGIQF